MWLGSFVWHSWWEPRGEKGRQALIVGRKLSLHNISSQATGPGKLQALVCCRICSVRKSGAWGGNSLWEGSWRRGRQGTTSWSPETATRWRSRKTYTKCQISKRVIMDVYLSRRASPSGRLFVLRMISFEKSLGRLLAISAPTIQPQLCPTNITWRRFDKGNQVVSLTATSLSLGILRWSTSWRREVACLARLYWRQSTHLGNF